MRVLIVLIMLLVFKFSYGQVGEQPECNPLPYAINKVKQTSFSGDKFEILARANPPYYIKEVITYAEPQPYGLYKDPLIMTIVLTDQADQSMEMDTLIDGKYWLRYEYDYSSDSIVWDDDNIWILHEHPFCWHVEGDSHRPKQVIDPSWLRSYVFGQYILVP